MEFFNGESAGGGTAVFSATRTLAAESSTPERLETLLEALSPPGSVSLLIGDAGTGKNRLALEAANALGDHLGEEVTVISLSPPANPLSGVATHFGYHFPEILGDIDALENRDHFVISEPEVLGNRLLEIVERQAERGSPLLIAPGLDQYSPVAAMMLEKLVRAKTCRVVATAQRVSGAVAHLARNPRVRKIPVPPLTFDEARRYLVQLLAAEHIELQTLRRWYRATEGNSLSLTLLALALDRRGLVGRQPGVVYELPGAELVPVEFHDFLHSTCSEEELRTLEIIAHVEPIFENVFIRMLDPSHIAKLRDRGLIAFAHGPNGQAALALQHHLLAAAVRERTDPERVIEVSNQLFDALHRELETGDPSRSPRVLFRLVAMGLDAHRDVPLAWLWDTFEILRSGHELNLRLRIALAIAAHPDASTAQLATAAQQAAQIARTIGDQVRLRSAIAHVRVGIERTRHSTGSMALQRVRLQCALIDHLTLDLEDAGAALAIVEEFERRAVETEGAPGAEHMREIIRTARVMLYARLGRIREAGELAPGQREFGTMPIEWERGGSRAVLSLVLSQRGAYEEAIKLAEYAESFVSVGERPQSETVGLLRFCGFIGFWSCGSLESAREELRGVVQESFGDHHYSGLIDTCLVLMSLADGKWRLAVQRAERLAARLAEFDRYGLANFVQAALALASAALGERAACRRATRLAEARKCGLSQVLAGTLRLLTLRARQWAGEADTATLCLQLGAWAREEQLPAVELQAMHLLAIETGRDAAVYRSRIQSLAGEVEPPFSSAILEHCEEILAGEPAWESPGSRGLTEFGIWMPLPQTEDLSAREREIALFAALGYSSRWIAAQFHLSVRTVDTHLRHVFTKLRVSGRDELRQWFRREQSAL